MYPNGVYAYNVKKNLFHYHPRGKTHIPGDRKFVNDLSLHAVSVYSVSAIRNVEDFLVNIIMKLEHLTNQEVLYI